LKRRVAVIGIGQSRHGRRSDVSLPGLLAEAVHPALADAAVDQRDIDAVVFASGPDTLEGIMSPELYLAGALGFTARPVYRAYTSGSAGGVGGDLAVRLVRSGRHDRVLVVGFEKPSEGRDGARTTLAAVPFEPAWKSGAGSLLASVCQAYLHRSGADPHTGAVVAAKDRANAAINPFAHVQRTTTVEEILATPVLWDPIRAGECSPNSDGTAAMVLAGEAAAGGARHPAWVHGSAVRSSAPQAAGHDPVDPAAGRACAAAAYAEAGITDPAREIGVAELSVPFSWFEPIWMENLGLADRHAGWRASLDGDTALGGTRPVNPSGGLLGANPIGAGGLLRFAEAARQVRGDAGPGQVDGAGVALGHAAGGFSNCFAVWIVGRERP
jgi:acetyl-CoA C-acetyltransferase